MSIISAKVYFILLILVFPLFVSADEGWNYIKNNDNKTARNFFIEALKKDSINIEALKGLIYISEVKQDKLAYKKYVNILLRNNSNEYLFSLFQNLYSGKNDFVLKQKTFDERTKLKYKIAAAEELKEKRHFEQSIKAYTELVDDFNWSLIGPFKNLSGSGHVIPYPVETESFDTSKRYINQNKIELKWVKPAFYNKEGIVNFSDHLTSDYKGNTYYANTFFDAPAATTICLAISRWLPMKIWIDDNLVFDDKNKITFDWDNECLKFPVTKGTHRVLVKISTATKPANAYSFLEFYDTPTDFNLGALNNNWRDNKLDISYDSGSDNENSFALRITDTSENLLKNIKQSSSSTYTPTFYSVEQTQQPVVNYFQKQILDHPDDLFNYYALCKAFLSAGLSKQAEPLFVHFLRQNKSSVLIKYVTAKLYARNGKIEKVYDVLNDIAENQTPIFGLLYEKFKDIDMNTDEQHYLQVLNKLKSITPSNYSLIESYLTYFDKKGMRQQKSDFIKEMKKTFSEYSASLDYELKKDASDYDREKLDDNENDKGTLGSIKSRFVAHDYTSAIFYHKSRNENKKVIQLYDELISIIPYSVYYREQKARFLLTQGKHELAIKEVNDALAISPYDNTLLELLGDVYADKSINSKVASDSLAVLYYLKSKQYGSSGFGNLETKINKIQGQKSYKKLFNTKSFDDVLNESEWKTKYQNEESIVLLYTRDIIIDSIDHAEVYQQLMIKILNESGAKRWTEYDFSFLGNINTLRVIKPSGTELNPDKQGGYVVIKNLEPGDVIQIDGVHAWEQDGELGRDFYMVHYVSFEAPIYYHKFEVAVSKNRQLSYRYHKLPPNLNKSTHNDFDFYRWEFNNIPKVESEEAVLDVYDLYSSIMISTLPDWQKVNEWYQQTTYGKFDLTYEVKEALDSIIKPNMTESEKVETIYNYLTKQIKYSYVSFLQSGYVPKDPGLTLSSRIGDCKDVATLMIVMLRTAGIEANYTLVKTNAFNHQEILPSLYFDHVIVQYKLKSNKTGFLDMTTDFYPYYVLTENDVAAWALNIKQGEKYLFQLPSDDLDSLKNTREYIISAKLNIDKTLDISVEGTYPGIAGGNIREYTTVITEQEQRNSITERLGKGVFSDVTLVDYKFDNLQEISKPLKAHYKMKVADFSDAVANLFICRIPYVWAVQNSSSVLSKERHNHIDVDRLGNVEPTLQKINLSFPAGYKLVEVPASVNYASRFGTYQVKFKKTLSGLYIEKYQAFNTKIVDMKDFAEFKSFYLKLLNLDKLKIAVQKI